MPRAHPKCLPLAKSHPQTFWKHVAHVQDGHEVVDDTVDALSHARVLQGSRGVSQVEAVPHSSHQLRASQ